MGEEVVVLVVVEADEAVAVGADSKELMPL